MEFLFNNLIYKLPALILAMTVHEYAHALAANQLGDPTPRIHGRLSFNPLVHIDPIGLLAMLFVQFGWAKPVPINNRYFRNGRRGEMLVSLAGPASNLVSALITAILIGILAKFHLMGNTLNVVLTYIIIYNLGFAIFNMIPVPPLDGYHVLISLLPGPQAYKVQRLEYYGPWFGIVIAMVVASIIMSPLIGWGMGIFEFVSRLVYNLL